MEATTLDDAPSIHHHEPTAVFTNRRPTGDASHTTPTDADNMSFPEVHRSSTSAYIPRPAHAVFSDGTNTPTPPPRRSVSSILRTKKKYAVRNSLLANIFFPHIYSHRVATVDEAKSSRIRRSTTSLLQRPDDGGDGGDGGAPNASAANTNPLNDSDRKDSGDDVDGMEDDDDHHKDTFLEKMARGIQSKQAQWFFTTLLVLDVVLIIAELVIESNKYCVLEPLHDVHHVGPTYHTSNDHCNTTEITYLGKSTSNHRVRYFESSQADCPFEAIPELSHGLHLTETVLSWMGKGIIFIFAAELLVLIAALRTHFFRNRMYLIDFIIVSVSIIVEWTVSKDEPSAQLVILVRCWRFARILHGVGISVHEMEEIEVEHLVDDKGNIVHEGDPAPVIGGSGRGCAAEPTNTEDNAAESGVAPPSSGAPWCAGDVVNPAGEVVVKPRIPDSVGSSRASSAAGSEAPAAERRNSFVLKNGREAQPPFRRQKVTYQVIRTGAPRLT